MASFYNAADQELYKKFQFLPQEQYRLGLNLPKDTPAAPSINGGITNTNAFNNSGGSNDFNPYNPDPNTVRNSSNYNERPYKSALYRESFPMMGDPVANQATGALNADGLMSYAGDKPLEGIPGAIKGALKNSFIGRGINAIQNILPVNKRGIMHNELLGSGFHLDGTGQFVSDGGAAYKADGSNIMAGYNSYHVDRDTFKKRRDTINNSLKTFDKYDKNSSKFDPDRYNQMQEKLGALDAAEKNFFAAEDRKTQVYDDKKLAKDPTYKSLADKIATEDAANLEKEEDLNNFKNKIVIDRFRTDKKKTKAAADAQDIVDADAVKANIEKAKQKGKNSPDNYGAQGLQKSGSYGGNDTYSGQGSTVSSSGDVTDSSGNYSGNINDEFAEGGRAGYFFGGRVNYKAGGRTDAGPNRTTASHSTRGQINESGQQVSGGQTTRDNNDDGASDNPPVTVVNNDPVDISTITKSVGNYDIPVGLKALMADKGRLQAVLNADNILDKNLGAEFTYDKGPFNMGAYADMDGDKSLNANYTRNNSNYSFDLNDGGGQLKFTRTFANGGLAGLL